MLKSAFLSLLATCNASTLADVVCNGKDLISFTFTANAGSDINLIETKNCPGQDTTLDQTAYTKNGDVYSFSFNPYTDCVPGTDPNSASSYNVDFGLLVMGTQEIDGTTVIFGGDTLNLRCTFLNNYQVSSELNTIALAGEEVDGVAFALAFEMIRTTDDYATETTAEIETGTPVYHVIRSSSQDKLANTDFSFKPYNIRLEKMNSNPPVFFDLFTESMATCGHSQLEFEMDYDSVNSQWKFKYNQILLDADLSAEYKIVADLELCNSLSTSSKCTAADKCTGPAPINYPYGDNWTLVRRVHGGIKNGMGQTLWHPATDKLVGSEVYGTYVDDHLHESTFSMKFDDIEFNEFMFASGDFSIWLVASKQAVIGGWYENTLRAVEASSASPDPYGARWYRRQWGAEDPWISMFDHTNGHQIVYGGNSHNHYPWAFENATGGMNVFIRQRQDVAPP